MDPTRKRHEHPLFNLQLCGRVLTTAAGGAAIRHPGLGEEERKNQLRAGGGAPPTGALTEYTQYKRINGLFTLNIREIECCSALYMSECP